MIARPTFEEIMQKLHSLANQANVEGQRRYGIRGGEMLGISLYDLRSFARGIRDHELALRLWDTDVHDARLLASMVDDPAQVTPEQMQRWAEDFESWDICDQVTDNLFIHADGILDLIPLWAERDEEFIRRAAFAAIAAIAWNGKQYPDQVVAGFFPLIEKQADDPRNFVKKAVNWALRNIGKKRPNLRPEAIACAKRLLDHSTLSSKWIARDAMREFEKKFGTNYLEKAP